MDNLTVLVTGSGAPGIKGTLYSLQNNFDHRKIRTVGTDIRKDAVGRYLCDSFYSIPRPNSEDYLSSLLSVCKKEHVAVLLPQNTAELSILARHKQEFEDLGTAVAVSDAGPINVANDKGKLLAVAEEIGLPVPRFFRADKMEALLAYARRLGWPEKRVVVKPPVSNGMRGLRIIDESLDLKRSFYEEKPTSVLLKMNDLQNILGESFPALLVTEFLPGEELTVDALSAGRLTVVPRTRDRITSGITFDGTVKEDRSVIDYSERLSRKVCLKYAFGFQFKLDGEGRACLLESNPRIQGTMVLATFAGANIIYGAVKHALGEEVPDFEIKWGTRILRYWGGLGIREELLCAL
ncbi:ATP-grasp in the biosynthetic pathway with Ter operon [uncultured archaeon]|nr:ATP-grasp in the biosynthetic pathway with Ter operon [uncultured archaeon]